MCRKMTGKFLFVVSLMFSYAAHADEPTWFVSVYGENMQLISGASNTPDVQDGVYLSSDYVGTEIYVRTQAGYELEGFRPAESEATPSNNSVSGEATMDSAAAAAAPETTPTSEFGPLVDTGVQYYVNGDYFGWFCSKLFVKPMGNGVDRLRCDDDMSHAN